MRSWILLSIAVVSLFVPPALAQAQPELILAHEVPDDGFDFTNNPTTFTSILLNADGTTNVHKNGKITVTQNGVELYETLGTTGYDAAHDYDALNTFLFAFPRAGPYTVTGAFNATSGLAPTSTFEGFAHAPTNALKAQITTTSGFASTATTGVPTHFTFQVSDANGQLLPHTDTLFEIRRVSDNFVVFRTHLHSHTEAMSLDYVFQAAGDYSVKVVGYQAYPTADSTPFEPVAKVQKITVGGGMPAQTIATPSQERADEEPTSSEGDTSGYMLISTVDPASQASSVAGPFGNVRLNALVFDKNTQKLVSHVNFEATLQNEAMQPRFTSKSLHEYDGNLEVIDQETVPGIYTMHVVAKKGDWSGATDVQFKVIPPVFPPLGGAGPVIVTAKGLDNIKAGVPQTITLYAGSLTANGPAAEHSEIEIQVLKGDASGVPMLINKLHTHGDGLFGFKYNFPDAGDYTLILDAESIDGEATPAYYYNSVGTLPVVKVHVGDGPGIPNVAEVAQAAKAADKPATVPMPGLLAFVGLAVAVVAVRARRQA